MYSTIPNHAIARIFAHNTPRRVPVGAGFLVSPRYLLTCAHVIEDVLEDVLEKQRASSLLLVVDQFEELYTPGEMTAERRRFVELLLDALACAERRSACAFGLLIALRSDFFDRTNSVQALSRDLRASSPCSGHERRGTAAGDCRTCAGGGAAAR